MKILLTGGTGFIGSNVIHVLRKKYDVISPRRYELNILNTQEVETHILKNKYDVILHFANPNPTKNKLDENIGMFESSLKCFMNFYRMREHFGKLLYIGSGAEFDKSKEIHKVSEHEFDKSVPCDEYGFAKYIMNHLAKQADNIYNLRIFACYGPGDWESKFITHCIRCVLNNQDITIKQDCIFDYLHVNDFAKILSYFIENTPLYHDYNIASGTSIPLLQIAQKVLEISGSKKEIKILKDGMNKEYTASISRLTNEIGDYKFMSLDEGITLQIKSEMEYLKNEKKSR